MNASISHFHEEAHVKEKDLFLFLSTLPFKKKPPQHHPSLFLWEKPLAFSIFLSVHCPFQMHNTFIHLQHIHHMLTFSSCFWEKLVSYSPVNTTNSIQANITGASAPYKQVGRADAGCTAVIPQCVHLQHSAGSSTGAGEKLTRTSLWGRRMVVFWFSSRKGGLARTYLKAHWCLQLSLAHGCLTVRWKLSPCAQAPRGLHKVPMVVSLAWELLLIAKSDS